MQENKKLMQEILVCIFIDFDNIISKLCLLSFFYYFYYNGECFCSLKLNICFSLQVNRKLNSELLYIFISTASSTYAILDSCICP